MLEAANSAPIVNPLAPKAPHEKARAKAVIHLFMHGGVSHVDTFDPKPELAKRNGETISAEVAKGLKTSRIDFAKAPVRGSPWSFKKHGQSGMEISELYPGIASKADEIALIRSCCGDAFRPNSVTRYSDCFQRLYSHYSQQKRSNDPLVVRDPTSLRIRVITPQPASLLRRNRP